MTTFKEDRRAKAELRRWELRVYGEPRGALHSDRAGQCRSLLHALVFVELVAFHDALGRPD